MIDAELLSILVCPEDKTPVRLADDETVRKLNAAIAAGTLRNRAGETVDKEAEAGLIREDNAYLYLVREDIPIMLIEESIPMAQLS